MDSNGLEWTRMELNEPDWTALLDRTLPWIACLSVCGAEWSGELCVCACVCVYVLCCVVLLLLQSP
jgi:hypothetical protein